MATTMAADMSATLRFLAELGVTGSRGTSERPQGDVAAEPDDGGHEEQDDEGEKHQGQSDGTLAAALTRRSYAVTSEFSVRVRGDFEGPELAERLRRAVESAGYRGRVEAVEPAGGEVSNRWIRLETTGLRAAELRDALAAAGLEANRILRTRYGPVAMDRALARGRSRLLTAEELSALRELAALQKPAGTRSPRR